MKGFSRRNFILTSVAAGAGALLIPDQISAKAKNQDSGPTVKGKKVLYVYGGWAGHDPKPSVDLFVPWLRSEGAEVVVSDTLESYTDKKLMESLKRVFRPEFINRLDGVIVFRQLNREDIRRIVSLELNKVAKRLADHRISLRTTEAAIDLLAAEGYDPDMGARPLRRVIQFRIEDKISDFFLSGEVVDGDTVLVLRERRGEAADRGGVRKTRRALLSEQRRGL